MNRYIGRHPGPFGDREQILFHVLGEDVDDLSLLAAQLPAVLRMGQIHGLQALSQQHGLVVGQFQAHDLVIAGQIAASTGLQHRFQEERAPEIRPDAQQLVLGHNQSPFLGD